MGVFNAFFFDEVTSRDYNLVIESKSILNAPEPDLQEYEIPGRDGTVFISNNRWRNVDISYTTFLRVPIQEDIQPGKGWTLNTRGDGTPGKLPPFPASRTGTCGKVTTA